MPLPQELEYWSEEVSIAFPNLSKPQAQVLALYSYGMTMTKNCGQTIVCVFLALLLHIKSATIRQRLKEFSYEAERKRGAKRCEVCVEEQFEFLLKWVLQQWPDKKKVIFGADVTYLKDRQTILTVSGLYAHTALPVAWKVLAGNAKGEWHPLWLELLAQLAPALPQGIQVIILFDRGLYSQRLFTVVRSRGWHPFMRIREQGLFKRARSKHWHDLKQVAYRGMKPIAFKAHCFKGDPLEAYLWVAWEADQAEACLLLSDLAPRQVKGNPYPLRMWIEANFKDWKRGGLHLEQCKTTAPQRLSRLILVLAVALFHLIRLGNGCLNPEIDRSDPLRRLSLVTLGWLHVLVATIHDTPMIETAFRPYTLPPFRLPKKTYP
jgi:Transposase DDE domain